MGVKKIDPLKHLIFTQKLEIKMEKQVNIINKKVDDNENIKSGYF